MTPNRPHLPGRYRAFVYAVLVHVALVGLLIIGFRFSGGELPLPKGKPVQAVVVEDPQKRKDEEEKKRQADEKRKEDEARKREEAEREQARREEEARKAEEQRRLAQQQKEEEQKKRQAEAKRKQEDEQRRKKEETERRQAAEEALKQQIAAEERARAEAARAARAASEADKYKALIRQKVSRNWNRPPGTKTGLKCTVRVRLVPGGEVLQATVVRSSGDPVFDRSVENAVYKAAPLPLPAEADLFDYFREIEFVFNPEA